MLYYTAPRDISNKVSSNLTLIVIHLSRIEVNVKAEILIFRL